MSAAFIAHCESVNMPRNTVAARARTLRSVGNAGTATREEIEAWWVTRSHLAKTTRTNDLSNLRAFYKWAGLWEHRAPEDNPTLRVAGPKVPKGIPRPATRDQLHRMIASFPDDLRRAVCLGAYAGLRVSEAAALTWADVDTEANRVYILDSKGSARVVKVSPVLIDHLLPVTSGNVVTGTPAAMTAAVLQRRVNRAMQRIAPGVTFHRLRHRFGVMAYEATGDILGVGKAMGHASPVTTAIYAQATDEVADRIAAAVVR